eukprot:scaffold8313_cov305-Pinguiococcus_pyrenoidosus.AAC.1
MMCSFTPYRFLWKVASGALQLLLLATVVLLRLLVFPHAVSYSAYEGSRMVSIVFLFAVICVIVTYKRQALASENFLYTQFSGSHQELLTIKHARYKRLLEGLIPPGLLVEVRKALWKRFGEKPNAAPEALRQHLRISAKIQAKQNPWNIVADSYSEATVLCVRIKYFDVMTQVLSPKSISDLLNTLVLEFEKVVI